MESRVCSNCGTLILPGDKVCLRCGKPVKMEASPGAVSYPANNQSVFPENITGKQSSADSYGGQPDLGDNGVRDVDRYKERLGQALDDGTGQTFVQPSSAQQDPGSPEQPFLYSEKGPSVYSDQQQETDPHQKASYQQQLTDPHQEAPYQQQVTDSYQETGYRQQVPPDVPSMQNGFSDPESGEGSTSSADVVIQDGMRRFLSTDQESWNRWMQGNIAWLEAHESGGRKEKSSKRWPFRR